MIALQETAIPLLIKAEALPVVVDHGDQRFEGRILARQPAGGILQSHESPPVGSILVFYLRPAPDAPPDLILEADVVGSGAGPPTATGLRASVVRWNWAYVKGGVGLLHERLGDVLGCEGSLDPASIVLVHPGIVYAFTGAISADPEEAERRVARARLAAARAEVLAGRPRVVAEDEPPLACLRAHERVRLDAPCRFVAFGEARRGRIYNIAREGVFVLTDEALPAEGETVAVRILVRANGQPTPIDLGGTVRWRAESPSSASGGGFGVHVTSATDEANGRIFGAFVDRLLTNHYATRSAQSWAPVDERDGYEVEGLD